MLGFYTSIEKTHLNEARKTWDLITEFSEGGEY